MGKFNERLKELRIAKDMTQDELANRLGVSKSTISMYENGNREPDFEMFEKIADFFNVNMDYLLGYNSDNESYYINDDVAELAQNIYEDEGLHMLFSAARDISQEDMQYVVDLVQRLKETNRDG